MVGSGNPFKNASLEQTLDKLHDSVLDSNPFWVTNFFEKSVKGQNLYLEEGWEKAPENWCTILKGYKAINLLEPIHRLVGVQGLSVSLFSLSHVLLFLSSFPVMVLFYPCFFLPSIFPQQEGKKSKRLQSQLNHLLIGGRKKNLEEVLVSKSNTGKVPGSCRQKEN